MKRRLLTPAEFAVDESARKGAAVSRLATSTADLTDVIGRSVAYKFSGGAVARDGHTINQAGWKLDDFLANPVFLWAHNADDLPIGKVTDLGVAGGWLRGRVEYAERDVYAFADTVFQMVQKGFLNAVSTSWLPIEWKFSTDRNRPGGIDFLSQDLLEISQVPVPAQADALVEARAAGIDTGPIFEWAGRMLDQGGFAAVPRSELELLRKVAKMPAQPKKTNVRTITGATMVRGLYSVSNLASILASLNWLKEDVAWEAEIEQDGSDIPARLTEVLKELGKILCDMTVEEVIELIGEEDVEAVADEVVVDVIAQSVKTPAQRFLAKLGCLTRKRAALAASVPDVTTLFQKLERMATQIESLRRGGKVLSAANTEALSQAMEYHQAMGDCIQGVLDSASSKDDETESQALGGVAARQRELEVLQLSAV